MLTHLARPSYTSVTPCIIELALVLSRPFVDRDNILAHSVRLLQIKCLELGAMVYHTMAVPLARIWTNNCPWPPVCPDGRPARLFFTCVSPQDTGGVALPG